MVKQMKKTIAVLTIAMVVLVAVSGCLSYEEPPPGTTGTLKITVHALELGGNITLSMDNDTIFQVVLAKGQEREFIKENVSMGTRTIDLYYLGELQGRERVQVPADGTVEVEFIMYNP